MPPDLLEYSRSQAQLAQLMATPEYEFVAGIAGGCFQERPTESVWKWAEREVWLDEKMTATPGPYSSAKTPWMREIQELPLKPEVREAVLMKPSRCGGTEGAFNIARWMPKHKPGNVGIVFPDDKKAREVAQRRFISTLEKSAAAQMSADPNDTTLSKISLSNMDILFGGSGASRMFTEIWFRYIDLEELEEHSTQDSTSTYDRAKSRQTDVPDAFLFASSKPKKAGGPIDLRYIAGTQKKYHVHCPRCHQPIELQREFFRNDDDCRVNGEWDLNKVVEHTWYQCQLCQGHIDEHEKPVMVDQGVYIPTPVAQRRRPPSGQYVPPEPGVESYHVTDYCSLHEAVSWGNLRKAYLLAFEIAPTLEAQEYYINNHEGWPADPEVYAISQDSIDALKAGRVESRKGKAADDSEITITETLGQEYRLAYRDGKRQAPLPFKPAVILAKIDKQESFLKYLVFAVMPNGESLLIDLGRLNDEDHLFAMVRDREYYTIDDPEPMKIQGGLMDSRFRGQEVFRVCLRMYHELGVRIWPVRGEGESERFKGRTIRFVKDYCDGQEIIVRYFYDNSIKNEFYIGKIQKRTSPRLWLPVDIPDALKSEWTAEKRDENEMWYHDKQKYGPNDWGDCGKFLVLWMVENLKALLQHYGLATTGTEDTPQDEPEDKPPERDYELKR